MAFRNAEHGKLLLTADLLQTTGRPGPLSRRIEDPATTVMGLRFPPIEDLVGTLDHIATRESAA
jgi:hypothetical protein